MGDNLGYDDDLYKIIFEISGMYDHAGRDKTQLRACNFLLVDSQIEFFQVSATC